MIIASRSPRFVQTLALMPLLIAATVFASYYFHELEDERRNRELAAEDLVHELDVFLELNKSAIELAGRMVARNLGSPFAIFTETLRTHPTITSLAATDAAGRVILTVGDKSDCPAFGSSVADDPGVLSARAEGRIHLSGLTQDPNDPDTRLLVLTQPLFNQLGAIKGFVIASLDIGDYPARIADLGRFHAYPMIVADFTGRVIHAPPETGLDPMDILPARYADGGITRRLAITGGSPHHFFSAHPVDLGGSLLGSVGAWMLVALTLAGLVTALIVKHLSRHARELQAANTSKTAFLAMTGHEIRTPLNAIIGLSDCLLIDARDSASREHLSTIRSAGEQLLRIVSDLLDLSRVEADKLDLRPGPVALSCLLREICALFNVQAAAQNLALQLEFAAPADLRVETDPERLRQVLINLVGNALKFTRQGSVRLRLELVREDEAAARVTVRFTVIDTGPGISPEDQKRLFEPYFRVKDHGPSAPGGTGLGLHISRRLVALLGGEIKVRSRVGQGSQFHFELTLPVLPPVPPPPAALVRPRVLAVDDTAANREVLHALLAEECSALDLVSSADEAVAALRTTAYDLALIDLEMPDQDGFAVLAAVRAAAGASGSCRLIAVSSHSASVMRERCLAAGFADFIGKPLRKKTLLELLSIRPSPPASSS